ncbi:MAG: hypothetical protein JWR12_2986 [Mucilaginibacter sp.]|nr:hypothetical protein [Mucilaginibacter sp.]
MANWDNLKDEITYNIDSNFEDIQLLFLSGKITKMYQLVKRSPTKVSKLLGINYEAYHSKLQNPEKFTLFHINVMAYAFRIDPDIINNIIQKEISNKVKAKVKKFEEKKKLD